MVQDTSNLLFSVELPYTQSANSRSAKHSNLGSIRRQSAATISDLGSDDLLCGYDTTEHRHSTDVLWFAAQQFTRIHNGIPQNWSNLCKLLVYCIYTTVLL